MQPLSVTTLTNQIKSLLETSFSRVLVEWELSRITYHNSGHIYFTLKDSSATIRAVMFRGNATRLKFRLEEGLKVIIDASITLYTPRGEYQLNCFSIEPSGKGALAFAFEQLKNKLSSKGYFDLNKKKQLPKFPKKVALITSATSAALQDMLRVAASRYALVEFDIYDVLVQGDTAANSIANAIKIADTKGYDVIVIGRGGGSIEDLWAFNEEVVANAVYQAKTPIISAVGHEIDTVISDLVADVRAATPSNAMEILLPDKNELLIYLDNINTQLTQIINQKIQKEEQTINHLKASFNQFSIENKIKIKKEHIQQISQQLNHLIDIKISNEEQNLSYLKQRFLDIFENVLKRKSLILENIKERYEINDPSKRLKTGYAQIVKDSKVIDISLLKKDEDFELQTPTTVIKAKVLEKHIIK
jgi:exodeoxyribonuclease VII large subunit